MLQSLVVLMVWGLVAHGAPVKEKVPLSRAYVPVGFDNDDASVEVIVTGTFKNTCYQKAGVEWTRDDVDGEILLTMEAYRYDDGTCWPIPNDFQVVVDLKRIPAVGDFELIDTVSGKTLGVLPIRTAQTKGPGYDDFPYAPVSDAWIKPSPDFKGHVLHLQGDFPNSCMEIGELKQNLYADVIVVQPIARMKKAPLGKLCEFGRFPYVYTKPLEKPLQAKTYLLHVRKMQGGSINRFVHPFAPQHPGSSVMGEVLMRERTF